MSIENVGQNVAIAKDNINEAVAPSKKVVEHMGSVVNHLAEAFTLTNQACLELYAAKEAYKEAGGAQMAMTEFISRALHHALEAGLEDSSESEVRLVPTRLDDIEETTQRFSQTVPYRMQQFGDKADELSNLAGYLKTAAMTIGAASIPKFDAYDDHAAQMQQTLEGLENRL